MLKIPSNTTMLDILLPESRATPLSYLPTKKKFSGAPVYKKESFFSIFIMLYQ